MAQNLQRTYGLRQLGDYEAAVVLTEELATQALEAAVEFVEQVRDYLENSDQVFFQKNLDATTTERHNDSRLGDRTTRRLVVVSASAP
ncbi:hypothetical protein N836_30000 [Leptolyngbya sp. Heron Island J]|nr:hypothetical protein N836_30000 [Leptolyngbya sp. Heron Island J]